MCTLLWSAEAGYSFDSPWKVVRTCYYLGCSVQQLVNCKLGHITEVVVDPVWRST